jgi:hypothetical protein
MKVALDIAIIITAFPNCSVVVAKFDFEQLCDVGVWLVTRSCSMPEARTCFQTDYPPVDLPSRVYKRGLFDLCGAPLLEINRGTDIMVRPTSPAAVQQIQY